MADLDLARASGPSGFESLAVVKRIRPHLAANPDFVRLFLGEAKLAAGLRHPNVVSVYDAGQERGEYYFVMEFVHGRDLRAILEAAMSRRRPLSFDEVVTIAVGVCAGLHHAHEATDGDGRSLGIVHRDISPSNVLVSFDGAVKLADFGIAKPTHTKEGGTNTLRGKLTYMSPEQSLGAPLDRRSDLYSLALVLYELTTGQRPFGRAASEFLEVKQALELPPRPPSAHRADYPPELEGIIMRALTRERDARYVTAREMQLDLEAFARRQQLALSPVTLAHLMEELFADELHAWQLAQRSGTSLAQHVTDTHSLEAQKAAVAAAIATAQTAPSPVEPIAAPLSPEDEHEEPTAARRPRRMIVAAALSAVGLAAFVVTLWAARTPSVPTAIDPPAAPNAAPEANAPAAAPEPNPPGAAAHPAAPTNRPPATAARVRAPAKRLPKPPAKPAKAAAKAAPSKANAKGGNASWDPEAAVLPH